jgi:DNA-binding response OmpR family regulator
MPKTILIVDDERDLLAFFSTLLEDNGYRAITASDGVEAMDRVRKESPDLVTLDINMPNKTGVKVYRELKETEELKKIPVVIVTGVDSEFRRFISTRRQVPPPEGYLEKPLKPEDLLAMVKRLIG